MIALIKNGRGCASFAERHTVPHCAEPYGQVEEQIRRILRLNEG
jgi:hypothetical protein